jgi:ATP-dependent DNA helicase RecG
VDTPRLQQILTDLETRPAGELESQTLEFKGWCRDEKDLCGELAEAAVCLANADGGFVIIGVQDRNVGRRAASACPYRTVTADWIRAKVREFTKPPVGCSVVRIGDVIPSPPISAHSDLFAIEVQKTNRPGGHRTHGGVSYRRSNNECRVEYFEGNDDYSRVVVDELRESDLDETAINSAATHRELTFASIRALRPPPEDSLSEFQLMAPSEDNQTKRPTIAALLLLGRSEVLKRALPFAETVLVLETSINTPLTASKCLNLIEALTLNSGWIREQLAKIGLDFPNDVIRELLLNAYLHRDYRTQANVQIHIRPNELEIRNPGGLLGSLTTASLIHSPSIYRNFLLADSARQYGYCERAGTGIDKIYYNLILNGFEFPIFESVNDSFSAVIRLRRDQAFATFIRKSGGDLNLSLTELIILRALRSRGKLAIGDLVRQSQRTRDYLTDVLVDLERRLIVHRVEENYSLSERILDSLAESGDQAQLQLFRK